MQFALLRVEFNSLSPVFFRLGIIMKAQLANKVFIQIAVLESDPLRFEGYRAFLSPQTDFELNPVSMSAIGVRDNIDVLLLANQPGQSVFDMLSSLRSKRETLRIIVTGRGMDDQFILEALSHGAKGCVDENASTEDLARAIRIVHEGLVWAPRRVLAAFVEHSVVKGSLAPGRQAITSREKQVLEMLVAGRSNKEIARPLGIEERTVKAHVSKLMRKVGVHNRIKLSVHAISHALVPMK
jgi:DNA-binding NarL/FixJ family response regulator